MKNVMHTLAIAFLIAPAMAFSAISDNLVAAVRDVNASNDPSTFFAEIQQLAWQEDSDAQLLLAFMYAPTTTGRWRFFPSDVSFPEKNRTYTGWLERSAQGGNVCAMSLLGSVFSAGLPGVPADEFNAEHWLRDAANAGDRAAPKLLLNLAASGKLIATHDDVLNWSTAAAEDDDHKLRLQAADYFLGHQGGAVDVVSAYQWTILAMRAAPGDLSGSMEVVAMLQEIATGMTAEQMNESERRADLWQPGHEVACEQFLKDLETPAKEVHSPGH